MAKNRQKITFLDISGSVLSDFANFPTSPLKYEKNAAFGSHVALSVLQIDLSDQAKASSVHHYFFPDLCVFHDLHVLPTHYVKTPFLLQHFRVGQSIKPIFAKKNNPDNSENPCAVKHCTLDSISTKQARWEEQHGRVARWNFWNPEKINVK